MANIDDLIAQALQEMSEENDDDERVFCTIDPLTRKITVPPEIAVFAVTGDFFGVSHLNAPQDMCFDTANNADLHWLCAKYEYRRMGATYGVASGQDQSIYHYCDTAYTTAQIRIKDIRYTDAAEFKASLSGVMLYYELAEPFVRAIASDDLIDTAINVEPGGTLTFSNGDDTMRIPVPNQETFVVNLKGETK